MLSVVNIILAFFSIFLYLLSSLFHCFHLIYEYMHIGILMYMTYENNLILVILSHFFSSHFSLTFPNQEKGTTKF